jgi:hypothetical protein
MAEKTCVIILDFQGAKRLKKGASQGPQFTISIHIQQSNEGHQEVKEEELGPHFVA